MAVIPLLNLDEVFGIALISSISLALDKYFFDFIPATRDTIFGFFIAAYISLHACMASFGFTPKKMIDFGSMFSSLIFFAPSFFVFLEFVSFLSTNSIRFFLNPADIKPAIIA